MHAPVAALTAGEGRKSATVGNLISHNRIHDAPNSGIVFAGNNNVIEYNEIYRIGLGSSDLGGIYTNSAWTARGNVIRHNFIHHSMNANALYMDDGSCGSLMEGNMTIRVPATLRSRAATLPWAKTIGNAGLVRDAHRTLIPPRDLELLRTADTTRTFDSQTDIDASNRK